MFVEQANIRLSEANPHSNVLPRAYRSETSREKLSESGQAEGHTSLVTRPEMLSKHSIGGGERERLQGLFVYAGGNAVKPR